MRQKKVVQNNIVDGQVDVEGGSYLGIWGRWGGVLRADGTY